MCHSQGEGSLRQDRVLTEEMKLLSSPANSTPVGASAHNHHMQQALPICLRNSCASTTISAICSRFHAQHAFPGLPASVISGQTARDDNLRAKTDTNKGHSVRHTWEVGFVPVFNEVLADG